ncbi:MAG: hypothetical protein ACLPX9_06955 [Rhodomicrobium sp.]
MPLSQQPCAYLIAEAADQAQSFFKSDAGGILLALLALANAILYYLSQFRLPESRELAAAVLVGVILAVLVAATESEVPKLMVAGVRCNSIEAKKYVAALELRRMRQVPPS